MLMTMRGTASILSNVVLLLVGVMSSHSVCDGYQFVINNTVSSGAYLQNITNIVVGGGTANNETTAAADAVEVIGVLYQDVIYDNQGNRLERAIGQGYSIYSKEEGQQNYNNVYHFQDDDGTISTMNVFNEYIMSANGTYAQYSGGTISFNILTYDPAYIAEVTLVEPPPLPSPTTTDADADETMTLRITDEGGWNKRINHDDPVVEDDDNIELDVDGGRDGAVIGMRFQDNVIDTDGTNNTVIGINTGFMYEFPKLDGIDTNWNTNRQITMRDNDGDGDTDETILIFNDVIVYATGKYSQFVGPFVEDVVPVSDQQPYFIADMTLSKSTTSTTTQNLPSDNDDDDNDGSYDFIIKSEGGFFSDINDVLTGDPIGNRFQNPILDRNGNRIGVRQGFGFHFPMPGAEFNVSIHPSQENRQLFFTDGSSMGVFNNYIVLATGNYTKYQGGQLSENVISMNPSWVAEVTLIPPKTTTNTDNNNDSNEEEGDKEKQEEEAPSSSSVFVKYNHYSFMVTAAAFYGYQ